MILAGGLIGVSAWFRPDSVLLPLFPFAPSGPGPSIENKVLHFVELRSSLQQLILLSF